MIKKITYLIQSLLIFLFFIFGRLVGIFLSRKIFSMIFLILGPLFKSKKIFEKNLNIYSENISEHEANKIFKNMWKNYGMTFIEYIFLNYFKKNNSHINIINESILNNIKKKNKPVIFVSGHFANYELMTMEITKKNIKLAAIYRPLNNIFLNPLMDYLREKYVCKNYIKKGFGGVRKAIEYIQKDFSVALMIDQRVSEGEKIKFFNNLALTTTLPAQLAFKYDLEIIPVFIKRINDGKFDIEFNSPINPKLYANKIKLTEKLNTVLEKMIIRNPGQWIWTHNRWK
ncbi:MAG: lysophospholipid acyltransferase family protein [Candidatus Pelagibacter sp.]|tara:strand:- start:1856 stop:2713 length:858 start_codon:yes stop_codon:yes gene_type:complete